MDTSKSRGSSSGNSESGSRRPAGGWLSCPRRRATHQGPRLPQQCRRKGQERQRPATHCSSEAHPEDLPPRPPSVPPTTQQLHQGLWVAIKWSKLCSCEGKQLRDKYDTRAFALVGWRSPWQVQVGLTHAPHVRISCCASTLCAQTCSTTSLPMWTCHATYLYLNDTHHALYPSDCPPLTRTKHCSPHAPAAPKLKRATCGYGPAVRDLIRRFEYGPTPLYLAPCVVKLARAIQQACSPEGSDARRRQAWLSKCWVPPPACRISRRPCISAKILFKQPRPPMLTYRIPNRQP